MKALNPINHLALNPINHLPNPQPNTYYIIPNIITW